MPTKIKVIGVGGAGCNAISRMMACKMKGVELIAMNTDAQDLNKARAHFKVRIGKILTKGLGTGMNPEIGKGAAKESQAEIEAVLKGTDMLFITCGLGGGTGTGGAPVISDIAKNLGILTVAVVTEPFSFEGTERARIAKQGFEELSHKVDTILSISNDKILKLADPGTSVNDAFWLADEILRQAVQGISELITVPGLINVDFADIKTVMRHGGQAMFGMGIASGENRAQKAAEFAIQSPLLDLSIEGSKGVLFNIAGSDDLTLEEVKLAAQVISQKLDPRARVIFGAVQDKNLKKGQLKVTVIATGFQTH